MTAMFVDLKAAFDSLDTEETDETVKKGDKRKIKKKSGEDIQGNER